MPHSTRARCWRDRHLRVRRSLVELWREVPQEFASAEDRFKYGSVGAEEDQGIPYWIWLVLPRIFPEYLPGDTVDEETTVSDRHSKRHHRSDDYQQSPTHDMGGGYQSLGVSGSKAANCPLAFRSGRSDFLELPSTVSCASRARSGSHPIRPSRRLLWGLRTRPSIR
ncbi:MAG: hypothetical protein CMJ78_05950 [Planctomycetaceae bacterium]|nr:hypothetical protein [Planctomycetaceae bacterium]